MQLRFQDPCSLVAIGRNIMPCLTSGGAAQPVSPPGGLLASTESTGGQTRPLDGERVITMGISKVPSLTKESPGVGGE